MKKPISLLVCGLIIVAFVCSGCARTPSKKTSVRIINRYFKKYAKKYKDTTYGKNGVKDVDIRNIEEIHKHLVAIETFITLGDGSVQRLHATLEKSPMGWKFVSWENATGM